ncbi:hypothetical protein C0J52_21982 [Blattella germanica]|nr:hypothetical protein C0J52_21982 [Blattella germanica]
MSMEKTRFFTADEKNLIRELVTKHASILECKKSDVVSVANKKKKWAEICEIFNMNYLHTKRTPKQIKKCWENLKTKRKQELAEEKRSRLSTGGGPFPEEEEVKTPKRKTEEEAKKRMERCVRLQTMDLELHGWRMEEATYKAMAAKTHYEKITMEMEELRRARDFQQEQRRRLQEFEEKRICLNLKLKKYANKMFQILKWRSINAALIALPLGLSSKASTGSTLS